MLPRVAETDGTLKNSNTLQLVTIKGNITQIRFEIILDIQILTLYYISFTVELQYGYLNAECLTSVPSTVASPGSGMR